MIIYLINVFQTAYENFKSIFLKSYKYAKYILVLCKFWKKSDFLLHT